MMVMAVAMLTACEVIPEDERDFEVFIPKDTTTNDSTQTTPVIVKRSSLLIEYSGWMCVNCPTAAEVAHQLKEQYGEQLVVVVMHPESNPNTRYTGATGKVDESVKRYICPESDSIYIMMGGSNATEFPTGNINMVKDETKGYFQSFDKWATLVSQAYENPKPVLLSQEVVGHADSQDIWLAVDIANLDTEAIEATLQVWLTEDSIIGKQKKPEGTDKNYVHNHLMRATVLPSVWGESCQLPSITPQTLHFRYTLPEKVVAENCNIVSVLSTGDMVIQATETSVQ